MAVLLYLREAAREDVGRPSRARDASGLTVEGLDLGSFDAWTAQVERGEEGIAPSVVFLPMARVERIAARSRHAQPFRPPLRRLPTENRPNRSSRAALGGVGHDAIASAAFGLIEGLIGAHAAAP
jgi:hypothetical protein